jgi:hypothetical protein
VQHQASPAVARPSCQTLGRFNPWFAQRLRFTVWLGRPSTRPAHEWSLTKKSAFGLGCPSFGGQLTTGTAENKATLRLFER